MGTKVSLVFIPFFPIVAFAAQEKSVDINVTAFVEAPTCRVIETNMESFQFDFGVIPLASLVAMKEGTEPNRSISPNKSIEFKCDGGAKSVSFKFNPTSREKCRGQAKGSIWNFFCNENKNGATLALGYSFSWTDKDGNPKTNQYIYSSRNFEEVESGAIKDGVFKLTLNNIYAAAYADAPAQLPGPASYTMGITVWSL